MSDDRTVLQIEADAIDCGLFRLINRVETLADRIPVAGAKLRGIAIQLRKARPDLRTLMSRQDRERTS